MKTLTAPLEDKTIRKLKAGEEVLLTGVIYTARDQAHARLVEAIRQGQGLPLDLKTAIIYYCGPTARPKGRIIGSCGPTTSRRMDEFSPLLLKAGLRVMIGKGNRSAEVSAAIKKYQAVYFVTYAGCGALLAKYVKSQKVIAYQDLGPEAIHRLEVENFPLITAIAASGKNIYGRP